MALLRDGLSSRSSVTALFAVVFAATSAGLWSFSSWKFR